MARHPFDHRTGRGLQHDFRLALLDAAPDEDWHAALTDLLHNDSALGLHVALVREPHLDLILSGQQTAVAYFNIKRGEPPYGWVKVDDVLLLKQGGEPITALARVGALWQGSLSRGNTARIKRDYLTALQEDSDYLGLKKTTARYVVVVTLANVARTALPIVHEISWVMHQRVGWEPLLRAQGVSRETYYR